LADLMDGDDVRVREFGGASRFAQEPVEQFTSRFGDVGGEHLDGDGPFEVGVERAIDDAETAAAETAQDLKAIQHRADERVGFLLLAGWGRLLLRSEGGAAGVLFGFGKRRFGAGGRSAAGFGRCPLMPAAPTRNGMTGRVFADLVAGPALRAPDEEEALRVGRHVFSPSDLVIVVPPMPPARACRRAAVEANARSDHQPVFYAFWGPRQTLSCAGAQRCGCPAAW